MVRGHGLCKVSANCQIEIPELHGADRDLSSASGPKFLTQDNSTVAHNPMRDAQVQRYFVVSIATHNSTQHCELAF
jgi:hypothetical protein